MVAVLEPAVALDKELCSEATVPVKEDGTVDVETVLED